MTSAELLWHSGVCKQLAGLCCRNTHGLTVQSQRACLLTSARQALLKSLLLAPAALLQQEHGNIQLFHGAAARPGIIGRQRLQAPGLKMTQKQKRVTAVPGWGKRHVLGMRGQLMCVHVCV